MSCSISPKHVKANSHILLWFSVSDTGISSNFKIKHSNCTNGGRIYKNSYLLSNRLVKDIFYCNHIPGSMGFQELNTCNLC